MQDEQLELTQAWDKVFPKSDNVDHEKITFHNRWPLTSTNPRTRTPPSPLLRLLARLAPSRSNPVDCTHSSWPSAGF